MMTDEQWRDVVGYEGSYQISDRGRVRSMIRQDPRGNRIGGKILKPQRHCNGYLHVSLWSGRCCRTVRLHKIVLEAFVGPCPDGMQCAHNNGIRDDNRLDNLRWDTPKGNTADQLSHGTRNRGARNGSAKLSENDVLKIMLEVESGVPQADIAQHFGVTQPVISRIMSRKAWSHVGCHNAQ